jgi:hypothetical protein
LGKQYRSLSENDIRFIRQQKLFYIASCSDHEVNLSPKGYDSLYLLDPATLYMLDYLGSGNRTARDIDEHGEITILFNAFEGKPKILRCFCKGEVIEKTDEEFTQVCGYFNESEEAIRQFFKFNIYAVESSCGMGVPLMEFKEERPGVRDYALKMAQTGKFDQYVKEHHVPPSLQGL